MSWFFELTVTLIGVGFVLIGLSIFSSYDGEEGDQQFINIATFMLIGDTILVLLSLANNGII